MDVTLLPGELTPLPGTRFGILWYGEGAAVVRQDEHGVWNVSPLVRHGQVLAFVCLLDHPELPPWPLVPLATRTTYWARPAEERETALGEEQHHDQCHQSGP